jgi:hypothetical protein
MTLDHRELACRRITRSRSGIIDKNSHHSQYYKLSVDRGNTDGQRRHGECFELGTGIGQNAMDAVKYYKRLADKERLTGSGSTASVRRKGK